MMRQRSAGHFRLTIGGSTNSVAVSVPVTGCYTNKGLFISGPPHGYEWRLVKDEIAHNVIIPVKVDAT